MKKTLPKITEYLSRHEGGDSEAIRELFPLVYQELHRIAKAYMRRERQGHTIQPTALVHEAFLQFANSPHAKWKDRHHFFAAAARAMRHILVNYALAKRAKKRGGDDLRITFTENVSSDPKDYVDIIALDRALQSLAALDPRKCRIIELRYFSGLSLEEMANALNLSASTLKREWNSARLWLYRELEKK